jgi:ABC-type multidrug transport system fused ATPase/permease subunit
VPTAEARPHQIALRLLLEALATRKRIYFLSIFAMFGVAGFTGALANSTKLIVNDIFVAADTSAAQRVALIVIGIACAKAFFEYVNGVIQVMLRRSVQAGYQKRVFANFVNKDVWFFLGQHDATQMAMVRFYGDSSAQIVVTLSNKFITDMLTLFALVAVMVLQDPLMSLICLVLFPTIFAVVASLSKRIRAIAKQEVGLAGKIYSIGSEAFEGIRTLKSYQLEQKSIAKFNGAVEELENQLLKIAKLTSATLPVMEVLGGFVIGGFVMYAAWQTIEMGATPGEFTAFITAFLLAYQPAERVSKMWVDVQKALVIVQQMYISLERPPSHSVAGTERLDDVPPAIAFEDVSFEYTADAPALHGVSFEIAAGERIAIVGRSGARKTTAIDLLQRFYDPTEGTVRIGGRDLREVSEDAMRSYIALISQDVFLFEGTIRDNIRDGRPEASDEELARAAHLAALDEVVDALPDGLETEVGPNGSNLSGGQKQRVGIARALLSDARIYIFDEATSALDARNERVILQNIMAEMGDATVVFVTHRASTLTYVDRVLMLEAGRVVAFDGYERLAREHPTFRALFTLDGEDGARVADASADADDAEPEDAGDVGDAGQAREAAGGR